MTVTAQVAVAQVIREQNDEIGRPFVDRGRHVLCVRRLRASRDDRQDRENAGYQGGAAHHAAIPRHKQAPELNLHHNRPACSAIIR